MLLKDHWFWGKNNILQMCKLIPTQYLVPQSLVLPEDPAVHCGTIEHSPIFYTLSKNPQQR